MSFKDQIDFIRQHMKKNRLRVFMTVLAATMGCAFLIVLASVGFGFHKTITDEMMSTQLLTEVTIFGREDGDPISTADQQKMRELENVKAVVSRSHVDGVTSISMDDRTGEGQIQLTNLKEEEKANLALSEGKMPTEPNEIVIGYDFAQNLLTESEAELTPESEDEIPTGYTGSMIGKTISLEITPFTEDKSDPKVWDFVVTGVAKDPSKDWNMDFRVLIDESYRTEFHEFSQLPTEESSPIEVYVYAEDFQHVGAITDTLKNDGYNVYSITEELGRKDLFFTALKAGLIFVGTIAVLISSIGIFNTMTMAVTERTREIGVMKAIGANPKLIQRLFLIESTWIGALGTIIAVTLSYGISYLANWIIPKILNIVVEEGLEDISVTFTLIPWQLVAIASFISIGVAMISGLRPARKATKIDVIQALRQEL